MSAQEEMTSLERIVAVLSGKKPDRVPVAPLVCGASHRVLGTTYDKWSMDAELCTQSLLQAQELIDFDCFVTLVDLSVEAYDWGQELIFPLTSTAYTNTNNPAIKNVEDYYKIERLDPKKTTRMKMNIDVCHGLAEAKGKEVAILGFVYGPLGVLSQLRGHDRLFKDCLKNPEAVIAAQEVVTETLIDYAMAQIDAGVHGICIDTLYASGVIMRKSLWEKIEGPFTKKFADAIHKAGVPLFIHNCGNDIYIDAQAKYMNPAGFSLAYPADDCKTWEEHAAKWGDQFLTIGYLPPSEVGMFMTPDEIVEECKREFETFKNAKGGFILSTGCEFPPNGSLINAISIVKAAKAYCRYN